ncbi:hypothetical protein ACWNX2_00660 [Candidatus Vidania fulgoroideorum]
MFIVFIYKGFQYHLDSAVAGKFLGNFPVGDIHIATVLLLVINGVCYLGMPYLTDFNIIISASLFMVTKHRSLIFKRRHRFKRVVGFKKLVFALRLRSIYFNGQKKSSRLCKEWA